MAYLIAAVAMTLGVHTSRLFVDCSILQESLALASMARDDLPASSTAAAAAWRPVRGKVGSELKT